jgi:ketosteroid isomerase-like protein
MYQQDKWPSNSRIVVIPPIGPVGYKQLLLFFADAFPSSRVEVTTVVATEQEAVIEFVGRGTNTAPLHLPTGEVPATGRSVELRFCDTIQIRKGKVVRVHIYYDVMTMLRQLGLAG